MSEQPAGHPIEPRWPVVVVILAALGLIEALPERVRVLPIGGSTIVVAAVLVPILGVGLTGGGGRWLRAERVATLAFCVVVLALCVSGLASVLYAILHGPNEASGLHLLGSSTGMWLANVLVFSLVYWQMDRGGPEARADRAGQTPDWLFPQEGARDDGAASWSPLFVDYLFLAYSTATAFSATDAPPLTRRAKLLMMVQSTISLVTMVVVASRAINVLGN